MPGDSPTTGATPAVADVRLRDRLRADRLGLVGFVVVGATLRFWALGARRLGFDEAFTALADRRPLANLFDYLRVRDSHPPLDYLVRLPFARIAANEFWIRLPSVLCSVGALALFAWWMRKRGLAGLVATAFLALSAFQLVHGREARMYAELELIGIAAAVVTDTWLRRPGRWHGPAIGALVAIGLLTHVSMLLLGFGLLFAPGLRRDRDAWRWRRGLGSGLLAWAVLWGPSFVVQSQGGHSSWIPPTSFLRLVETVGGLMTPTPSLQLGALVAVAAGAVMIFRADGKLGTVFVVSVVAPAALATIAGLVAPVMLDRTLTLLSWGPWVALGYLVAATAQRSRLVGLGVFGVLAWVMVPLAIDAIAAPSNVDRAIRHLERVTGEGDVVASDPGLRLPLLVWSLGVQRDMPVRSISMRQRRWTEGVVLGKSPPTGRVWVLTSVRRPANGSRAHRCAADWSVGGLRVSCLQRRQIVPDQGAAPFTVQRTASSGVA